MNLAILLAGGIGTRINTEVPKQYVRYGAHMMITYALKPLLDSKHIDFIHIVAEHEWRENIVTDAKAAGLDTHKIRDFAVPGTTRQVSILNAMQNILTHMSRTMAINLFGNPDTVLIHDAARPFLKEKLIDDCFKALPGHEGVMPVLPIKNTIYRSTDGHKVSELLDRGEIYAGQAPELFCLGPYYWANMKLMPEKIHKINGATEPAFIAGMDIVMIDGDERNFKVTTDEDMARFMLLMEKNA